MFDRLDVGLELIAGKGFSLSSVNSTENCGNQDLYFNLNTIDDNTS